VVAVIAFGGFLFGKHIAGLAGVEDLVLIVAGLVLLGLEIFVIPGTGVTGIVGGLSLMTGVVLAFVDRPPGDPFFMDELSKGISALAVSLIVGIGSAVVLALLLRRTRMWKRFSLQVESNGQAALAGEARGQVQLDDSWVARTGLSVTALRPEGEVEIDGTRVPARAEHGFIDTNIPVIVVAIQSNRVVVASTQTNAT
jgi:membrane-bound serine protease (ClpP class)